MSGSGRPEAAPAGRPWQVEGKRVLYHSRWVGLEQWAVRLPDGSVIPDHHVVIFPRPGVAIVPRDAQGNILLVDHYRFITDTRGWEVPAGGVDEGETVAAAGARELLEETGHCTEQWRTLGVFYPSNGVCNQTAYLLAADDVRAVAPPSDQNEVLGLRWFAPDEVRAMLRRNEIQDGFSITALWWALSV